MPKIQLDSDICFVYYARLEKQDQIIHIIISRYLGKEEAKLDTFFVYPDHTNQMSGKKKFKSLKKELVDDVKNEVIGPLVGISTQFGDKYDFKEELLDHDNFEQSMAWIMKKPELLKVIKD
jgi:hypothetical protein